MENKTMTDVVDPQEFVAKVAAGLTAPGAPFEMTVEPVLGVLPSKV